MQRALFLASTKYSAANPFKASLSWAPRSIAPIESVPFESEADEEDSAYPAADRRAGLRPGPINTERHHAACGKRYDGSRRRLRADWTDSQWRTGLFDEVREPSRAAAAGQNGRNDHATTAA